MTAHMSSTELPTVAIPDPAPTGKPDQDPGTDPQDPWLASQPTTGIMHGPDPQEDPGADNDGDCLLSTNGAVIAKSSCRLTQASYLFRILPLLRGGSVDSWLCCPAELSKLYS